MPQYLELEVSLAYIKPRIWRRFLIHEGATLEELHLAMQRLFLWENYHLYEFFRQRGRYRDSLTEYDEGGFSPRNNADQILVRDVLGGDEDKKKLSYLYDFGDSWEHKIVYRKHRELEEVFFQRLLSGARNGPLEDCGGSPGYERLVELRRTGEDPWGGEREELEAWCEGWDPEAFVLEEARRGFDLDHSPLNLPKALPEDAPKAAHEVLKLLKRQMKKRSWPEWVQEEARQCWVIYVHRARPRLRKPGVYAASVEYCMTLRHAQSFSQQDLARSYEVSAVSISQKHQEIWEVCEDFLRSTPRGSEPSTGDPELDQALPLFLLLAGVEKEGMQSEKSQALLRELPPDIASQLRQVMRAQSASLLSTPDEPGQGEASKELRASQDSLSWPVVCCMVPQASIWQASGVGAVVVIRQAPTTGERWGFMAALHLEEGGLRELLEFGPWSLEEMKSYLFSEMRWEHAPCAPGSLEEAAAYLWGALAFTGDEIDASLSQRLESFLPRPPGQAREWVARFGEELAPVGLCAQLAQEERPGEDAPEDQDRPTVCMLRLEEPEALLSWVEQATGFFTERGEGPEGERCFTWTGVWWSLSPRERRRRAWGELRLVEDRLVASVRSLSTLAKLMQRVGELQERGYQLEHILWAPREGAATPSR